MRLFRIVFIFFASIAAAAEPAQTVTDSRDLFPLKTEFSEVKSLVSVESFSDPGHLSKINGGNWFLAVGLEKYTRRTYELKNQSTLSIEIVELKDSRAAYSLLTFLRNTKLISGPPGDIFASRPEGILFAQGNRLVRLLCSGSHEDLLKRVAQSVSNRIGTQRQNLPSLISHFPDFGYDSSSVRYFLNPKSYDVFGSKIADGGVKLNSDMEIVQARYSAESQAGILSLLSLPTDEIAEDYFKEFNSLISTTKSENNRIYTKRTGPLLAILEGSFDSATAEKIMSSIQYEYAIKWIYKKDKKPASKWGIPRIILGTTITSLLLVIILFGACILIGIIFVALRFFVRSRARRNSSDQQDQTNINQLRLR